MARSLIALGSNLGAREQTLDWVVTRLSQTPGLRVLAQSRWHETAPVGGPPGQGRFLNGAVLVETAMEPEGLLAVLQQLETERGRGRETHWGPRTLDLDILLYDHEIRDTPALAIPHPRMAWRRFVLEPAAEVAAEMVHPTIGWTIEKLLRHLNEAPPYVAITGRSGVGKTDLARRITQVVGAQLVTKALAPCRREAVGTDSSSIAWDLELEFLEERTRLLAADRSEWRAKGPWISDFWLGQSLAYAAVCLSPEQQAAFHRKWEEACRRVVAPKLLVLLDASTELSPAPLDCEQQRREQVRHAILAQTAPPGLGPVLRLTDLAPEQAEAEVQAAIEAMR